MLAARDGMGRLPNGDGAQLVERTGKSRTELKYRAIFASQIQTEQELVNALTNSPLMDGPAVVTGAGWSTMNSGGAR